MRLLIDCCLAGLTLALTDEADTMLAEHCQRLRRGHAEQVRQAIDALFLSADIRPSMLTEVVATCGPGSFTGVRVGLAVARALSLATGCAACAMTSLAALGAGRSSACLAVVPAPRGGGYAQFWDATRASPIWRTSRACSARWAAAREITMIGGGEGDEDLPTPRRLVQAAAFLRYQGTLRAPTPLYLRPPDAVPRSGAIGPAP